MVRQGSEPINIKEMVEKGTELLSSCCDTPRLDASVILAHVLGRERWYLAAHGDEVLPEQARKEYLSLINLRLSGIPVQYLIGHQEFMSLDFLVDRSVLIPRPDTEVLVEEILGYISAQYRGRTVSIADVGTGSGCIAISIAKYAPNTEVTAIDISEEALEVARKNAYSIGVSDRISFVRSDLFSSLTDERFDIILSNPPYIPSHQIRSLQVEVREQEPNIALDGGKDGLDFYRRLIRDGCVFLKPGGLLGFEIGYDQAGHVEEIAGQFKCYSGIKVIKDLAGRDRVVTISRKI